MDQAAHRAGTVELVIAPLGQPILRRLIQLDVDVAVRKLKFKLQDELINHAGDNLWREIGKRHNRIETVAEFRREELFDGIFAHIFAADIAKANALPRHVGRAGIGGHDQDDIAEIDRLAVVIGQAAIVHHLQQDVEQVRMRLFDFVEQQHAVRLLINGIGQ